MEASPESVYIISVNFGWLGFPRKSRCPKFSGISVFSEPRKWGFWNFQFRDTGGKQFRQPENTFIRRSPHQSSTRILRIRRPKSSGFRPRENFVFCAPALAQKDFWSPISEKFSFFSVPKNRENLENFLEDFWKSEIPEFWRILVKRSF